MRPNGKLKKKVLKAVLWVVLAASVIFFLKMKKEALIAECVHFLETSLSRGMGYDVKISQVSGQVFGHVKVRDVEVQKPWLPEGHRTVFKAGEIDLSYRFLDLLSKQFLSKIVVTVKDPELYWNPYLGVRRPSFPFLDWMKEWALTRKENIIIYCENMTLVIGDGQKIIRGIDIRYKNNKLTADIPLSHVPVGPLDVSSVLKVEGVFQAELFGDIVKGQIHTEGTVINWTPLPQESHFEFSFSRESFEMVSSDLLGGIEVTGKVDFARDYNIDFSIKMKEFAASNIELFFSAASRSASPLRMDLDAGFEGNPWAPSVRARTRIFGGKVGRRTFKAMDLNLSGIYPTVQLEDSRILLDDGITMRFADKVIDLKDLFKGKTYEQLISEAEQDTVVWGDWEFSRPKNISEPSQFLLQRGLGDPSNLQLQPFGQGDRAMIDPLDSDKDRAEIGFEYRLLSKDSLKVKVREDEEFIGVERKMRF